MDSEKIIKKMKDNSKRIVEYVSDSNACTACKRNNGKLFWIDDSKKPKLPIHPNCRCKYVEYKSSSKNKNTFKEFIKNLPEATQIALEMKYMPPGVGELIGAAKISSVLATNYAIWAARASKQIEKHNFDIQKELDLIDILTEALEKNDIKTILRMYNRYKKD